LLEDLGTQFLKQINYYGLCEVEFIYDIRDQQYKFLEVNPRIWGWHTLAIKAGVNIPYFVYLDLTGKETSKKSYRKGIKWMRLMTDIPVVFTEILKRNMYVPDYFNSIRGEKEFAVLSAHDPLPFLSEFLLLPYLWKKRGF
jgi:predicted ATP-grasp superfamily ATP-dependent carboligase